MKPRADLPWLPLWLLVAAAPQAAAAEAHPPRFVAPYSVGDIVAADHMVAACPTMDVAVALNADPHGVTPLSIGRMAAAKCIAVAPMTRIRVMDVLDSGVVRVNPVNAVGSPLYALGRDFRPLPR